MLVYSSSNNISITADSGWKPINNALSSSNEVPGFFHGQMITYFVCQNSLPAGDFKGINKKARKLFQCGHIQNISLPKMKKDMVYYLLMKLNTAEKIVKYLGLYGCKDLTISLLLGIHTSYTTDTLYKLYSIIVESLYFLGCCLSIYSYFMSKIYTEVHVIVSGYQKVL